MTGLLPAFLVGITLSGVVCGLLLRGQARHASLAEVIDLPFGMRGVAGQASPNAARKVVDKVDRQHRLDRALARAHLAVRPEQFALAVAACGLAGAAVIAMLLDTWVAVPMTIALAPVAAAGFLTRRAKARRRGIEAQLPDALSVVAGSLAAGHTFLRALQLLCEECPAPLGEELARVVRETQLGTPVVDALAAVADRVDVADLRWVVQAIRIQQEVGGKLADLLHTLADFMRSRDEVRREVRVLTAEGRMSAWVLGALPVLLLFAIRVMNPRYLAPMLRGWGLIVLGMCAGSVALGFVLIRKLVDIEV